MSYDSELGQPKQKTAIRQLIEKLKKLEKLNWDEISTHSVINLAEELEHVNEQQIKDAYLDGDLDCIMKNKEMQTNTSTKPLKNERPTSESIS